MNGDNIQETVGMMMRVMRQHRKQCENVAQELGIHHSQHRLLMTLARCDTPPSQKELAARLHISPAAMAVTLNKLEAGGYIRRKCTKADKRQNDIIITESGSLVINKTRAAFSAIDAKMFEDVSQDDRQLIRELCNKMYYNLKGRNDEK